MRGEIHFRLWGVPVTIQPMAWVVLAIIGGGFSINDKDSLVNVLCFVVAGMLCLLTYEFGHALAGRRLGGGNASVLIAGLGGVTRHEHAPSSRLNYFMTALAGPVASLMLGLLTGVILGFQLNDVGAGLQLALLMPLPDNCNYLPEETQMKLLMAVMTGSIPPVIFRIYSMLFMVCFWWSVFNLLPILPLDGGRLLATLLGNNRAVCIIGLVICSLLAVWSLTIGCWFNFVLVGYLGWLNWQFWRAGR